MNSASLNNNPLDTILPPWVSSPYSLVTWWDMEQFSGQAFFHAGYMIQQLQTECLLGSVVSHKDVPIFQMGALLDEEAQKAAIKRLKPIPQLCLSIGLPLSAAMAGDISEALRNKQIPRNYQWLDEQLRTLSKHIQREMGEHGFFYISPERGKYWPKNGQPNAFGDDVANSFASTIFDSRQGAICVAIGLGTAAAFHLMRVLEIGLAALGAKFGVSLAHTNWGTALDQIESKIRDMHKDSAWKALPNYKDLQEKYAQAASHFGILKDAWRNYTVHHQGKFTEDEAELLFKNVKGFMQKLADLGLRE